MNAYKAEYSRPGPDDVKSIEFKAKNDGAAIVKSKSITTGANGYRVLREDGTPICRFAKGEYSQFLSELFIKLTDEDFEQINKDSITRKDFVMMILRRGTITETAYHTEEHSRCAYQKIRYDGYLYTFDVPIGPNQFKELCSPKELAAHSRPQNLSRIRLV